MKLPYLEIVVRVPIVLPTGIPSASHCTAHICFQSIILILYFIYIIVTDKTKLEFAFFSPPPQEISHKNCRSSKSKDGRSLMSCLGSTFMYGYKGLAKSQLKSLAALSSVALQSVQYDCRRGSSAMRAVGWNGAEISIRESEQNLMQDVEVEHNCEVSI